MALDKKQLGSAFNQIAYAEVMKAAVRDYQKELLADERAAARPKHGDGVDIDDLLDDPELEKLHAERLAALKEEAEKRAALERKGHGAYTEISEGEFLELVTKTELVVVQFYHKDFERCRIVDQHLALLARKHLAVRFVKLSAPDAPFFTVKLGIQVLPAVLMFKNGVVVGRIVGFDQLGGKDDFSTAAIEARLRQLGMLKPDGAEHHRGAWAGSESDEEREDDGRERQSRGVRQGLHSGRRKAEDDESSDFD